MSKYQHAVIAFGIAVKHQDLPCLQSCGRELTLGEYLAERAGLKQAQWGVDDRDQVSAWRRAAENAEDEAPIEILHYGDSPDCWMNHYLIAVKGTAAMTGPEDEPVNPSLDIPDAASIEAAADFCRENEITAFEDPRWILAALDATECACC